MQIVLNTLQTDSGDQPGSSCLSQKQKMEGDARRWVGERPPPWALGGRGRRPEHPAPGLPHASALPACRLPAPGSPCCWVPPGTSVHAPLWPGLAGGPPGAVSHHHPPPRPAMLWDTSTQNEGRGHHVRILRNTVLTRIRVWEAGAKLLHKPLETRKERNPIGSECRELSFLRRQ